MATSNPHCNGRISRCIKACVLLDLIVSLVCMLLYIGDVNVFESMHRPLLHHLRGTDVTMTTKHMPPSSSSSYSIQTSDIEDDEKGVGSSLPLHAGMRLQYAMPPDAAQTREERDDMTASWYDAIVSKEPIRDPQGAYSLVHLVLLRPVGHDVLYGGAPWKKQAYVARYYGPDDGRWRILSSSGDHDDETISSSPRLAIRPSGTR
mmetsp:Transcript_29026/g.81718  ORF Transcript_29026/g.81718 Transcript_29026/m.81718 type:complete len:205 (+) Transcript_29026:140-754(+)